MKIVVLNESFITADHIQIFKDMGFEVDVYKFTKDENELIERSKDAEIIITDIFVSTITPELLKRCNNLKLICINSTGYDLVDLNVLKAHGVQLANVPGFSTESVAELAIGLMFALNRKIVQGNKDYRNKPFLVDPGTPEEKLYLGSNLKGKVFGVYGLGAIGSEAARIAKSLGMRVIYHSRSAKNDNYENVDRNTLLSESDFLSVNLSLNKDTENIIRYEDFKQMKSSAYIINVSRGKLISEEALVRALNEKLIAGAGLDSIVDNSIDNPLLSLDNVIITPHIGWLTEESLQNIGNIIKENVISYIETGSAKYKVN